MSESLVLILIVITLGSPLLSALMAWVLPRTRSTAVAKLATVLLGFSAIAGTLLFFEGPTPAFTWSVDWFTLGTQKITAGIFLHNTTRSLLLVVSVVSFLVHLYSIGYMKHDANQKNYFAMLGFFTFSMMALSAANNLLLLFCFWELIGFSSYQLIGHWKEKPSAASAAKKAFLVNRLADLGFIAGLMIVWREAGTFDLNILLSGSSAVELSAASFCFLIGALGKSAQLPLYTWLPDAMEGPTPVSALIHAATLVAAGVFVLARLLPLFTPFTLTLLAIIGALTALLGALFALAQFDIKKILAYSTMSQLGFMMTALGTGDAPTALLHLHTHAFFKAGLFLAAGSLIHALQEAGVSSPQDIRSMGGLQKKLPVTFMVFAIGSAALAGIPFTSGFLSKDAILTTTWQWAAQTPSRFIIVAMLFITIFITTIYTWRALWYIFLQEKSAAAVKESPATMTIPMIILAIQSMWWSVSLHPFDLSDAMIPHLPAITITSAAWVILGVVVAWAWMRRQGTPSSVDGLREGLYLDRGFTIMTTHTTHYLTTFTAWVDRAWIDRTVHGFVYLQVALGNMIAWCDRWIIDGFVNTLARLATTTGAFTRSFQGGKVQLYILWAMIGLIIFLFFILIAPR